MRECHTPRQATRVAKGIACVACVERVREGGIWAREGERTERLQGRHCFLHFSRSDSERENSDWSELMKCQSLT